MKNKILNNILFIIFLFFPLSCTNDVNITEDIASENESEILNTSAPLITKNSPQQNILIRNGENYSEVTFTCEATPASDNQTLSYQWYKGTPENCISIPGANANSLTAAPPQ